MSIVTVAIIDSRLRVGLGRKKAYFSIRFFKKGYILNELLLKKFKHIFKENESIPCAVLKRALRQMIK